jgi:hypothetical protein
MVIEEKLKSMKDIKVESCARQSFRGGEIDFKLDAYKKKTCPDLLVQSRRPKAISKAYKLLNPDGANKS